MHHLFQHSFILHFTVRLHCIRKTHFEFTLAVVRGSLIEKLNSEAQKCVWIDKVVHYSGLSIIIVTNYNIVVYGETV